MILKEIPSIQTKLNSTKNEKLSQSLKKLEKAIEKQNKPKIIELIQTLTTDVSSSLLSSLASSSALEFLGIELMKLRHNIGHKSCKRFPIDLGNIQDFFCVSYL